MTRPVSGAVPPVLVDASVWVASLDPADPRHTESVAFLRELGERRTPLVAAGFVFTDLACTIAARLGPDAARRADAHLARHPALRVHPLADALFQRAAVLGARRRLALRAALYAALAGDTGAELVSWDGELVDRLRATPPDQWRREPPTAAAG